MTVSLDEGFILPIKIDLRDRNGLKVPIRRSQLEYLKVFSSEPRIADVESSYAGEHMGYFLKPIRRGEFHISIIAKYGDGTFYFDNQSLRIDGPYNKKMVITVIR